MNSKLAKNLIFGGLGVVLGVAVVVIYSLFFTNHSGSKTIRTDNFPIDLLRTSESLTETFNPTELNAFLANVTQLESLLQTMGPFQRSWSLHNLLATATSEQLQDCFMEARHINNPEILLEFEETVVRKLAILDPERAVELISNHAENRVGNLIELVFEEWSIADLDESITFAEQLSDELKLYALKGILRGGEELTNDEQLELGERLDNVQVIIDLIASSRIDEDFTRPSSTWYDMLDEYGFNLRQFSDEQLLLMAQVAAAWIDRFDESVLTEIFDSLGNDKNRTVLFTEYFVAIYDSNPDQAFTAAQWLNSRDREILVNSLTEWTSSNPTLALEFAKALEQNDERSRLQRAVLESWFEISPDHLLENLEIVDEDMREWSQTQALMSMTRTAPELVPHWLDTITEADVHGMILANLAHNWGEQDPVAALEWAASDALDAFNRTGMLWGILPKVAELNPKLALKTALQEPLEHELGVGMESVVIEEAVKLDTELGLAMLDQVRNSQTMEHALRGAGRALIEKEEYERALELFEKLPDEHQRGFLSALGITSVQRKEYEQAITIGSDLSADAQIQYFNDIARTWVWTDREAMFENLKNLPTREIQSSAAKVLSEVNEDIPTLSEDQLKQLENFIIEEE
ncbi:MAG: hypothetical protein OXH84_00790 [Gammaproteobacteria bacterium]|nr:hypothetical protein [Gammaproteobacteria bacterium]